jgi:hypothetical protein
MKSVLGATFASAAGAPRAGLSAVDSGEGKAVLFDGDVDEPIDLPASLGDRRPGTEVRYPGDALVQQGGPVLDVTRPPEDWMTAAVGDGQTDDTQALRDAFDLLKREYIKLGWGKRDPRYRYYIYLPHGTYRVSEPFIYRGEPARWPTDRSAGPGGNGWDITDVRIVGQSREGTVIRLDDQAEGFQDPGNPQPVVAVQHLQTEFNNAVARNAVRHLTINSGRGNPGAAGLMFQGANSAEFSDIHVFSEDGRGAAGLWFNISCLQGHHTDLYVEGFDYGLLIEDNGRATVMSAGIEHATFKNQRKCAICHQSNTLTMRAVLSDQAQSGVPFLKLAGANPMAVVTASELHGRQSQGDAITLDREHDQFVFLRDIKGEGYTTTLRKAGRQILTSPRIKEFASRKPASLRQNQRRRSMGLPVQDMPIEPSFNPDTEWASVDAYGAVGNGKKNSREAVQEALNSGKPKIYFPGDHYRIDGELQIPATVQCLDGMMAKLDGARFSIIEPGKRPLYCTDLVASQLEAHAPRPVILRRSFTDFANKLSGGQPLDLFLMNANQAGKSWDFCPAGQRTWARSINVESPSSTNFPVDGGMLWVMGYKTENKPQHSYAVRNGGHLEVLGGFTNMLGQYEKPIYRNIDSNISVVACSNHRGNMPVIVEETRGERTRRVSEQAFMSRGGRFPNNEFIYYVSYRS